MPALLEKPTESVDYALWRRPLLVPHTVEADKKIVVEDFESWKLKITSNDEVAMKGLAAIVLHNTCSVTFKQLKRVFEVALKKVIVSQMEPGEAVGAIAAQVQHQNFDSFLCFLHFAKYQCAYFF